MNAAPDELTGELEREIDRVQDRSVLMESLLHEALRHGYMKQDVPPTWLAEAKRVTER